MQPDDIRSLSIEEIDERLREEQEDLEQLRFEHAIAQLPNPMILKKKRRTIARLKTIRTEKQNTGAVA
ncbi:MAG: 50S ribosomal protein L29 [Bacteroidetes bacterium SW_4_67_19]|jgi:large subunit ribosomal protein L29|nr:MAG: 50S ribosomal protein L29 [Bacteroidetes bacterium QH_9_67_14]PSQ93185.1 MAG: 50S ribosomal protein L29 [Bacteroidetes bacterium SW_4_67_19]